MEVFVVSGTPTSGCLDLNIIHLHILRRSLLSYITCLLEESEHKYIVTVNSHKNNAHYSMYNHEYTVLRYSHSTYEKPH